MTDDELAARINAYWRQRGVNAGAIPGVRTGSGRSGQRIQFDSIVSRLTGYEPDWPGRFPRPPEPAV